VEHELPQADLAIIGEPSKLSLITSHKGSKWIKVAFHGKSCHASMPERGLNAVVMAAHFINALEEYTEEQFPERKHEFCGSPTINVGTIRSDNECPNIVPERCEIVIDRRWVPNETIELEGMDAGQGLPAA
jgi:acetylornithine deacetylase/succinyl-diaminopimelate desuccinylase-like protein